MTAQAWLSKPPGLAIAFPASGKPIKRILIAKRHRQTEECSKEQVGVVSIWPSSSGFARKDEKPGKTHKLALNPTEKCPTLTTR
jgi:hypothetical protein